MSSVTVAETSIVPDTGCPGDGVSTLIASGWLAPSAGPGADALLLAGTAVAAQAAGPVGRSSMAAKFHLSLVGAVSFSVTCWPAAVLGTELYCDQ